MRTVCQNIGYFYYSENLNRAAQTLRLARGPRLVIAVLGNLQKYPFRQSSTSDVNAGTQLILRFVRFSLIQAFSCLQIRK